MNPLEELIWYQEQIRNWEDILRVVKKNKHDLNINHLEAIEVIETTIGDFRHWRNELKEWKIIEGGKK